MGVCVWGGEACTCVKVWCRSGCMRVYRAVCQSRRVLKKHMRFPKATMVDMLLDSFMLVWRGGG